jgi:hypothetical protein
MKDTKALSDPVRQIAYDIVQVLGYLKSARLEHGLLINFGSYKFQIRKFAWSEETARAAGKSSLLLSFLSAFFAVK